jgi:3-octaprenyl-4-hydroxybenzoate carboxy-lyase
VHCPPANNGTTLMIQLKQTYRGQAKQAAAAIWGSNAAHLRYKNIWVVNDDIDIHDYGALDWAFAYRVNAAEDDIVFFPSTFGSALDPSTRLKLRDINIYGTGKYNGSSPGSAGVAVAVRHFRQSRHACTDEILIVRRQACEGVPSTNGAGF